MTQAVATTAKRLTHVTAIVSDLDRALEFYTGALGMEVRDDREVESEAGTMRWLTIGCPGQDLSISLQLPMAFPGAEGNPDDWVGNGTMWVLEVDDCRGAVDALRAKGVTIMSEPEAMPWGISAVIRDPDGNPFNLVQPNQ